MKNGLITDFGRITAFKCHRVACPHKGGTSASKIIKEGLNYNEQIQTKAMRERPVNEELIITQYIDKIQKEGHEALKLIRVDCLYQRFVDFWELP